MNIAEAKKIPKKGIGGRCTIAAASFKKKYGYAKNLLNARFCFLKNPQGAGVGVFVATSVGRS